MTDQATNATSRMPAWCVLELEAEHYERMADEHEHASGPGTYVDTLRGMAAQRRESAQWLRDHTPGGAA